MSMEKIVEFSHVSVEFPGVRANDDVSFSVNKGEIFALVGENGAGKSTLMNVLYGIHTPASGEVFVKGEKVTKFDPKEAIRRGIGMVHQHFMLIPSFINIFRTSNINFTIYSIGDFIDTAYFLFCQ